MSSLGYANLGLPSRLNVDDENDMNWLEASMEGQSVEEEFNSYVVLEGPVQSRSFTSVGHNRN